MYNQLIHEICCYKCEKLNHTQFYCDAFKKKQLTSFVKKYIMTLTKYNFKFKYDSSFETTAITITITTTSLFNQITQQQSFNASNTSFQFTMTTTNYYNKKFENFFKTLSTFTFQSCNYMYNSNKSTSNSYEFKTYSIQIENVIDDENMKNEKSRLLNCNSIILSFDVHEKNINSKILTTKRRRITNKNDSKNEITKLKNASKITNRFKKTKSKKKKKKILKFITEMINKFEINVKKFLKKKCHIFFDFAFISNIFIFSRRNQKTNSNLEKKKKTIAKKIVEISKMNYATMIF